MRKRRKKETYEIILSVMCYLERIKSVTWHITFRKCLPLGFYPEMCSKVISQPGSACFRAPACSLPDSGWEHRVFSACLCPSAEGRGVTTCVSSQGHPRFRLYNKSNLTREVRMRTMPAGPCKAETFTSIRLLHARQGLYAQRAHALAKDRHTGLSLNKRWPEIGSLWRYKQHVYRNNQLWV